MSHDFIKRYWFLAVLVILIPIGMTWPGPGNIIKANGYVIPVLVGIMLGIAGFTMDTSKLVEQSSNFRAIIPVLASTYILAPLVAYGLSQALAPESDENFLPAMMIMAAQAGSLASAIALTLMAGGNRELALICTLISNGFTVLLTPFVLELSIGTKVTFPISEMIARMALVILLPVAAGQLLRPIFWERARRAHDFIRIIPQFIILMFVYTGFSAATGQLSQDKDLVLRFFAACALLHLVLLGANTLLSGALKLQWPDRTALILCGSQKTLPNGIYIWNTFFVSNPYGAVPLVLYHLFQLIVDTLLVPFFEKRNPVSHENCGRSTAISCHQSE